MPSSSLILDFLGASIIAFVLITSSRQSIHITDEGLQVSRFGSTSSLLWSEARLFAVYDGKRTDLPIHYELSSAKSIVQWRRIRRKPHVYSTRFGISAEEYDRRMDALLSIIATKTGLPLYDLR